MRKQEEAVLLAAFQKISDDEDRQFLLRLSLCIAGRQVPKKPALQLIAGGKASVRHAQKQ